MAGSAKPGPHAASAAALAGLEKLFLELYTRSGAEKYGLAQGDFARILAEIGAKYLPAAAGADEAAALFASLRVEELALARACAAGS